jgi:hypothetical protein
VTPPPFPGPYPSCNKLPTSEEKGAEGEEGEEGEEDEERKAGCAAVAGKSINEEGEEEEQERGGMSMKTACLISPRPPHSCSVVDSSV